MPLHLPEICTQVTQHDKLHPRIPKSLQGQHNALPSPPLSISRIDNDYDPVYSVLPSAQTTFSFLL